MTDEKCPKCDVRLPLGWQQAEHMSREHPEVIRQRLREAAADGWEDE